MLSTVLSILLLSSTPLLAYASPVSLAARAPEGEVDTDSWSILSMKMHYFNENTGMGWPWAEGHVFPDSTLEFEVSSYLSLI